MSAARQRTTVAEPPIVHGRVPTHDLDAEAAVLSACLLDRASLDVCLEMLTPEDFYSEANQRILEACRELAKDGTPVDVVNVASWLRKRELIQKVGGTTYLGRITDATPAVAHVESHAQTVLEHKRIRRAQRVCQVFAAEAYGDFGEAQTFIEGLEHDIYELAHAEARSESSHVKDALTTAFTAIYAAANSGHVMGLETGYVDLDQKIAGLHAGDVTILAARPGMGKTSFVLNVAANVAEPMTVTVTDPDHGHPVTEERLGKAVAIFELEMPKEQVAIRLACAEARVDLGKLRRGHLSQDDWKNLTAASAHVGALPIHIDDTPAINLLQLRAKVRRIVAEDRRLRPEGPGLGLIIVDYLQLMSGTGGKGQSREQEVSEVSRGLKQVAKEFGVPVIALSQLNREVEKRGKEKRPILADLRDSGAVEQDADTVIFIYRDEYYNPEETNDRGIAELIVSKQRNGPTGTVRVRFVSSCTKFENLAPGEYMEFEEIGEGR